MRTERVCRRTGWCQSKIQSKSLNLNWRWWINFIQSGIRSDSIFWCTKYLYIVCKTIQIETSLNEKEFYLNCCNSAVFNEWVLSVHITGVVFWYQLAYQIMMKMKIVQLVPAECYCSIYCRLAAGTRDMIIPCPARWGHTLPGLQHQDCLAPDLMRGEVIALDFQTRRSILGSVCPKKYELERELREYWENGLKI